MQNPIYKIRIDDLCIRCAEINDAKAQKEAVDSSLEHLHEFMLWSHYEPETIEQKQERLKQWRKDYIENKDYAVVVFRGYKMVASSGLHTKIGNNILEIGYWVRADEVKKGIATKVSIALSILAFEYIKVKQVEIRHHIKNLASSKVPQKLFFERKDNYIDEEKVENGRWVLSAKMFAKNKRIYKKLYQNITFYDIENQIVY